MSRKGSRVGDDLVEAAREMADHLNGVQEAHVVKNAITIKVSAGAAGTLYEATTKSGPNLSKIIAEAQQAMLDHLRKGGGVGLDVTSEDAKLERIVRDQLAREAQKVTAMGKRPSILDKTIASHVRAGYVRAALGTDGNRQERRAAAAQRRGR